MSLALTIDRFLREPDSYRNAGFVRADSESQVRAQMQMIIACGVVYGAVMGSFNGVDGDGWKQMLVSGSKVPLLFLVTFLLCLPSFFILNLLAGLHADFPRVLNAVLGFQSLAAIVLAVLSPLTGLINISTAYYDFVVLWNGVMFGIASLCGHWMMSRLYRPLIATNRRHALVLRVWVVLYWFVGIQMAWVLRPFIGDPHRPVQFFREEAWGNAYVKLAELILRVLHR